MQDPIAVVEYESTIFGRHQLTMLRSSGTDGLERSAYLLLSRLDVEGAMTLAQLSEAFGLDTSTLNRQARAVLEAGLAERVADPEGGQARKIRLTEAGRDALQRRRAVRVAGLGRVLAEWDPDDVRTLGTLLERFNTAIEARDGRHWPRATPTDPAS